MGARMKGRNCGHAMLSCPFQRIGGLEGKGPAVASQPAEAGNIVWGLEPGGSTYRTGNS